MMSTTFQQDSVEWQWNCKDNSGFVICKKKSVICITCLLSRKFTAKCCGWTYVISGGRRVGFVPLNCQKTLKSPADVLENYVKSLDKLYTMIVDK